MGGDQCQNYVSQNSVEACTFRNRVDTFRNRVDTFRNRGYTFRNRIDTFHNRGHTFRNRVDMFRILFVIVLTLFLIGVYFL